jgi:hypothetical protein
MMKGHETCLRRGNVKCANTFRFIGFSSMSPVRFQFVVTMAIPRTTAFTSQRKMRRVSLVVGLILLVCLAADAVENSSSFVASAKKVSHSSGTGRRRQQRFLRSRRVQSSQPASINNEPPPPLGSLDTLGILPAEAPETQNAPSQGEASVEENATLTPPGESGGAQEAQGEKGELMSESALAASSPGVPVSFERQEANGGQSNNEASAYGSEGAAGLDIDPSVLQSGILGILPVTIPENQNVSDQEEAPVAGNTADTASEESVAQEEAVQPVRDTTAPLETQGEATGEGGGDSPPAASEDQNKALPPTFNEGRDISPPPQENPYSQIAPPLPERHSTIPEPEGNGGQGNTLPAENGSQGGLPYHQQGGDGRIDSNEDIAGTVPVTDDKVMEEIKEEERKVRTIGGFGIFLAIFAMIFTAWQMSDNPDGIYAAMCRLIITIIGLVMRIILSPCRSCFGGSHGSRNYAGHMPVSTMDYGYRDPALELS